METYLIFGITAVGIWLAVVALQLRKRLAIEHANAHKLKAELALALAQTQQAQQANDLEGSNKTLLLSVVSHDVRGPLRTLGQMIAMTREGLLSTVDQITLLEGLDARLKDTESLLDDVLLWAKAQMEGLQIKIESLNPATIIAEVLRQSRTLLEDKNVTVVEEGHPLACEADAPLLRVVVRNLLQNAVRYGPHGGKVIVRYGSSNGKSTITILDQGSGLDGQMVALLTEDNAHAWDRRALSYGGLGLLLVRDFTQRLNGTLSVQTSDKGTAITLQLPGA